MEAGGWVLTEDSFQFPEKVEIAGPIRNEDPEKIEGEDGLIKKTIRMNAAVHFTLMCASIVKPSSNDPVVYILRLFRRIVIVPLLASNVQSGYNKLSTPYSL